MPVGDEYPDFSICGIPCYISGEVARWQNLAHRTYVGLEMAERLALRGLGAAQVETLPEVLPTVDAELRALVRAELGAHGVDVSTSTTVRSVARAPWGSAGRFLFEGSGQYGRSSSRLAGVVLVSVGVRPERELLVAAGAKPAYGGRWSSTSKCAPG